MAKKVQKPKKAEPKATESPPVIEFTIYTTEARKISDALTHCMANEKTRYYLNGVCFESSAEGGLMAVATDGQRLGRLKLNPMTREELPNGRSSYEAGKPPAPFKVIAPRHFIKRIATVDSSTLARGVCTIKIEGGWIYYKDANEGFSAKLIDATFPDWRMVLPVEVMKKDKLAAFNAKHLAQMGAAIRKVHGKGCAVGVKIGGESDPAVFQGHTDRGTDFLYILMPMRM